MALVRPGFPGPQAGGATPPTLNAAGQSLVHPGPTPDPGGPAFRMGGGDPIAAGQALLGVHPAVAAALGAGGVTAGGASGYTPDNPYGPVQVTPHGAGYTASTLHPALGAILGTGTGTNTGGHPVWGPTPPAWWPAGRPWPPGSGGSPPGSGQGPPLPPQPVPQPWPWWLGGPPTQGL